MSTREMICYYAGGGAVLFFCIAISYWSVNFFIRQFTERSCQQFREHMLNEAERALKLFREGLCEQIVQQENRSDSLAKLYATLIDLLRVGKEFVAALGSGELQQAEKMLRTIRSTGETFAEMYQKQSLHFPDEFCSTLKGFMTQQKSVVQLIENSWGAMQGDAAESGRRVSEIKQNWLQFEDRITCVMDLMRNEFRNRHPAGNIMMKWLNAPPPPGIQGSEGTTCRRSPR